MNKKKIDQYLMLALIIGIIASSVYLFSEDVIPEAPTLIEQPAPEYYAPVIEQPIKQSTQPIADEEETPVLFDGVTIGLLIIVIVAGLLVVAVMKVSTKARKSPQVEAPSVDDELPMFLGDVAPLPMPDAQRQQQVARDFPAAIYDAINAVLSSRGGQTMEGANFWIEPHRCTVNPLFWSVGFDYRDGRDPKDIHKYLLDIQSRLCKTGYDTNVRIDAKRCVIEIENPNPPIFNLRQSWEDIKRLPPNERSCAPGVEVANGKIALKRFWMKGERAGTMIAGRPGSGKTQVMLSSILTACLTNSPSKFAVIIADIKGDTKPLEGLPHLAMPVITEVNEIVVMLQAVVAEMNKRQRMATKGDRSFNGKVIAIYLDEVTSTLLFAGDYAADISENIQKLTLTGRSLGFIVTMATQRIYDLPDAKVYGNCGRRFGLKLNTAQDSYALTGAQGTRLNDLRGRGAFEIFDAGNSEGERGQGFFVADPEDEGYTERLQWYVDEIRQQWPGQKCYYTLELPEADDYDTETPRAVKRSWADEDYDGFGNTPGGAVDDFTSVITADDNEVNAGKILAAYQYTDLFDDDGNPKRGAVSKAVREIFGNDAKAAGYNWDQAAAALDLIKKWEIKADSTFLLSTNTPSPFDDSLPVVEGL